MSDTLLTTIKTAMRPLVDRFGLRVERAEQQRDYAEVVYVNAKTGLRVAVDWSEFRPFLQRVTIRQHWWQFRRK
jgi:hypothetical protein